MLELSLEELKVLIIILTREKFTLAESSVITPIALKIKEYLDKQEPPKEDKLTVKN